MLEGARGAADHLGGERDRGARGSAFSSPAAAPPAGPTSSRARAVELDAADAPREVDRLLGDDAHAWRVRLEREQREAGGALRARQPRRHHESRRRVGREHDVLRAVEHVVRALGARLERERRGIPARALLDEGERRDLLARRDAGQAGPAARPRSPRSGSPRRRAPSSRRRARAGARDPAPRARCPSSRKPKPWPPTASGR